MAAQPQLKFLAIVRTKDKVLLATESIQKASEASFANESKNILGKLDDISLRPDERQKIRSSNGSWFCTCDDRGVHYLLLAESAYPERHAYGLISEVKNQLKELQDYALENPTTIQNFSKKRIAPIFESYNDLSNVDTLAATQKKANQIKDVMSDTISKALDNRETFDNLDHKSSKMSSMAADFHKDSVALRRKMEAKRRKMIIYGTIAAVLIVVVYFVAK